MARYGSDGNPSSCRNSLCRLVAALIFFSSETSSEFTTVRSTSSSAQQTVETVIAIRDALFDYKHRIREQHKFYSQDVINSLFMHPYTKIEFMQKDLQVSRLTATKYLDALTETGFLQKQKMGRSNYYINHALTRILATS